ncbi:calcium-binding tyrosine phosphorylation-regulated protein-like [Micropterus dolomieu]|uniref:calcium-binding tyrosine phosphorylation-regulated protein-like n=1 Tax=Micropterus dolomieu TaxID=147949 RepID=UPI001E8EB375|nr:calcium-binding tyrosine phosphorylation-regulated protein-like [Micropterus dolomieu]
MNFQSLCPYGLRSMMECISRATLLSQPTNIPDFLLQYVLELIRFRRSHPEADPKVVSFHYQELWENKFLRNTKGTTPITEKSVTSPQFPSQAEIEEALKQLSSDLASSTEENVVTRLQSQKERLGTKKTTGKDKKPSATPIYPTPPPRIGRQFGKNIAAQPFLVAKAEGKPALPPSHDVSMKTPRISSVRFASLQQSKETTDDIKKRPETCWHIPTPILKKSSTPTDVSASKSSTASKPSKLPRTPVPIITQKLVLSPIPGQLSVVQSKAVSPKPRKGSSMKRQVLSEKPGSRSPAHRALRPIKAEAKPKGASGPRPESTHEPREPKTESTRAGCTTPKVQELGKKNWIHPNRFLERTRGQRVLWAERERVKPIRTVGSIQGTGFSRPASVAEGKDYLNLAPVSSPYHTCPHLAHAVHILRYKRMQVRASPLGHSGPSLNSHHHCGL